MPLMSLLPHATSIPSPPINGFHVGPLYIRFYGLMYVVGIAFAIWIARVRWRARGGSPDLVDEVALWGVPAGIIGGRIYFDITTPAQIPPHWWGVFAVWEGGLGIWGGIALAAVVGIWRVRRAGASVGEFMDVVAPAILVAQAVGRIGNYFNQELFGGPTSLPWALQIAPQFRPPGYEQFATFHPTFLYELIWDLALAAFLIWLGHHRNIKPQGLFALYVTGYSAFRIFEESIRVDYSQYFLGLRLNFFVASVMTLIGIIWFLLNQRRTIVPKPAPSPEDDTETTVIAELEPDEQPEPADATAAEAEPKPAAEDPKAEAEEPKAEAETPVAEHSES